MTTFRKISFAATALAGALLSLASFSAAAYEKPFVAVSRNWPMTITVSWMHTGVQAADGDALFDFILEERLPSGQVVTSFAGPNVRAQNFRYTEPNQTYGFRVCARYNLGGVCSDEVRYTTDAPPPPPPPKTQPESPPPPQRLPRPVIRGELVPFARDSALFNVRLTWVNPISATQLGLLLESNWYRNGAMAINQSFKPEVIDIPGPRESLMTNRYKLCMSNAVSKVCSDEIAVAPPPLASNDFNGDGHGDILWHNATTGEAQIWKMSGASRVGRATLNDGTQPVHIGPPWHIVGSRDFNGDRKSDVLWHNSSTGETQFWFMDGARLAGRATVVAENGSPIYIGPPWSIVGTSDMNGDRQSDIVWHNSATGETQIWFMNAHRLVGRATVLGENGSAALVGTPWRIAGINDMNGDGKADIVWHNGTTGETQLWFMNGHRLTGRATVIAENGGAIAVGAPWRIVGTNDFNQDGKADIVWHNGSSGETQMWFMNGRSIVHRATVNAAQDGGGAFVGLPWSIMNQ